MMLMAASLSTLVAMGQSLDLDAQRIFGRMVNVYATAKTYQDKAIVKKVFYKTGGVEVLDTTERVSNILFDRTAGTFRFECERVKRSFSDLDDHYLVWVDGKQPKVWWTMNSTVENKPALEDALVEATSVSDGLSFTIPGLLLRDTIDNIWSFDRMTQLHYIGKAKLNQHDCYQVRGTNRFYNSMLLWIDQKTYLLIGIDKKGKVLSNGFQEWSTTRFEPKVNLPIAEENFTVSVPRLYWLWFWPKVGNLLWLMPPLIFLLLLSWNLFRRFQTRRLGGNF